MTITLTRRLQAVADLVPHNCRFADIGTDHAYLPVWLIQNHIITHAIAGDIRPGPLDRAKETARRFGCTDRLSFRLSDGLQAVNEGEADCIAIAGMGGEMIISILQAAPWTRQGVRLILQPQSNLPELRRWLSGNGYRIRQEQCLWEEGHWYSVLLAEAGESRTVWTPGASMAGDPATWVSEPQRSEYLRFLLQRTQRELDGLKRASHPDHMRIYRLTHARKELNTYLAQLTEEDPA